LNDGEDIIRAVPLLDVGILYPKIAVEPDSTPIVDPSDALTAMLACLDEEDIACNPPPTAITVPPLINAE
jgi:hypothetical protein